MNFWEYKKYLEEKYLNTTLWILLMTKKEEEEYKALAKEAGVDFMCPEEEE